MVQPVSEMLDAKLPPWAGRSSETVEALLARLAALPPDRAAAMPFFHPRLLQPAVVARLETSAASVAEHDAAAELRRSRDLMDRGRLPYRINLGPVERLLERAFEREISIAEAQRLAADPCVGGQMHRGYLMALGRWAVGLASDEHECAKALDITRVIVAAAEAAPAEERVALTERATSAYVECARAALCHRPDDALYHDARTRAQAAVEVARGGTAAALTDALGLLGRLSLDPYTTHGGESDYDYAFKQWRRRAVLSGNGGAPPMPEPRDALREASEHLREAVGLGVAAQRAGVATPLVQALYYRHQLFGDVSTGEVAQAAQAALAALDPVRDSNRRLRIERMLAHVTGAAMPAFAGDLDVPALVQQLGRRGAIELVLHSVGGITDPDSALALIDSAKAHAAELSLRSELVRVEIALIGKGEAPDLTEPDGPVEPRARELAHRAELDPRWTPDRVGATLVRLAARSRTTDEEARGLELLKMSAELAPGLWAEREEALAALTAQLTLREACNRGQAGDDLAAIAGYGRALGTYILAGDEDGSLECLKRATGAGLTNRECAQHAVAALALTAAAVQVAFGERATALLMDALHELSAALVDGPLAFEIALLLQQAAKGARFATALAAPGPVDLRAGAGLLTRIAADERALRARPQDDRWELPDLDEATLLTAYVQPEESEAGTTADERFANLQREFDRLMAQHVHTRATEQMSLAELEPLQRMLGDRTVLVTMFLGGSPEGPAVHTLAITGDGYDGCSIPLFPAREVTIARATLHPVGLLVAHLRERLAEKPDFRLVDPEAEEMLATELPQYFGRFAEKLAVWREQGRDHLCVWAHGPLHFVPFALFQAGGAHLAEHWTVTTVPALTALGIPPAARGGRLLTVGCGDGGLRYGLAAVPEMETQALQVAAALGAEALTGPAATRERFLDALGEAEYVHVAAHGAHNVNAPAFQCLYLNSDAGGDGRVFAYDLIGRDLRHVKLVTLSACETALGRFDRGDDLRGLPAALMLAGASAIVGTLWPVEPEPASAFFTTLYAHIGAGEGRLAAFRATQRHTRRLYPHACDWGAFVYMGDWREAPAEEGAAL